jgi:signal peptidase I
MVQPLRAQRSVEMPQTQAFTQAYGTALSLAKAFSGSRVVAIASTYSMYPLLDWDSIVVIVPASLSEIRVGDVVCFRDKDSDVSHTILHRVERILVKDGRLVTRGDRLDHVDPHLVFADSLVGKAVYVVYFDRTGEQRTVSLSMPTPKRTERIVKLFRN